TIFENEHGVRKNIAKTLLDKYKTASKLFFAGRTSFYSRRRFHNSLSGVTRTYLVACHSRLIAEPQNWWPTWLSDVPEPKTDRQTARKWEKERSRRQVHINQPIIADIHGNGNITGNIGDVNGGTSNIIMNKRDQEEDDEKQTKRVRFNEVKLKKKLSKRVAPEETLDSILSSQKKWILPSGENVGDIIARNVSANAKAIQKKKKTSAIEKATLRYGSSRIIDLSTSMKDWFSVDDRKFMIKNHNAILQVPRMADEEISFVTTVENLVFEEKANEAYKLCIETHFNSKENSYLYKLSKIYCDLCKNQNDMLDFGHTEIDIIMKLLTPYFMHQRGESFCPLTRSIEYIKGRKCDVRFLSTSGVDLGEWEFASILTAQKAIRDRCRSARINQSILNGLLNRNLNDEQAKKINVPFLQVAGTSGQMLVEDLVEGFYVVFPGSTFEFPTKLQHIENLKLAVNIIKFVMEKYNQTNKIVESKVSTHNALDDIFSNNSDPVNKHVHCKSEYIFKPWWTPKSNKS
ncbi:16746_t:CDS:10, partial [Funneliformis caledonium]